eukprot:15477225-Alexandrium_andersonii.AAC.1
MSLEARLQAPSQAIPASAVALGYDETAHALALSTVAASAPPSSVEVGSKAWASAATLAKAADKVASCRVPSRRRTLH